MDIITVKQIQSFLYLEEGGGKTRMEAAGKKILCGNLGTTADRSKAECDRWVKAGKRRKDEGF